MPIEAFRFVHASNLLLDHAIRDTGLVPPDLRETVEDAFLIAFEKVLDLCLREDVDFLLLTGNSFDTRDRSLRAQVALKRGVQNLSDNGVQVFVVGGLADPPAAWQSMGELPDGVTLLQADSDGPVAVLRNGHVIATIAALGTSAAEIGALENSHQPQVHNRPESGRSRPFAIGIRDASSAAVWSSSSLANGAVDYLTTAAAVPRCTEKAQGRVFHTPGGTQGRNLHETGVHGCSLVDVTQGGHVECQFVPTAAVRFESWTIQVDVHSSWDELVEQMQSRLAAHQPERHEQVWVIQWQVAGGGELLQSLRDERFREDRPPSQPARPAGCDGGWAGLIDLCEQDAPPVDGVRRLHRITGLLPDSVPAGALHDRQFATEFFEHLQEPVDAESLLARLDEQHLPAEPFVLRLRSIIGDLDNKAITGHAIQQGIAWFGAEEEGAAA